MDTITIYFRGQGLAISKSVAEKFNLVDGGDIVLEQDFWKVFKESAKHELIDVQAIIDNKK